MAKESTGTLLLLAGIGAAAYFTRASWLPSIETEFPTAAADLGLTTTAAAIAASAIAASGAATSNPAAVQTTLANSPVTVSSPGSVPLGTQGCFQYPTGTDGSYVISCPPGVNPPATTQPANTCATSYTQDVTGLCTLYPDSVLLANLNTIRWTGLGDIPSEQIARIDPQILAMYSSTTGVTGGSVLAYLLGLGNNAGNGTIVNGDDGNAYLAQGNVFYRQGTSSSSTVTPPSGSLNGLGRLGRVAGMLPVTGKTLIAAASDPAMAAILGSDPRAMLTASQWNYYYTQASGVVQGRVLNEPGNPQALISATQYHAARKAAGLDTTQALGTVRNSRRGAFPLGAINQWVPPGNRNIYRIPGRGAVPAGPASGVPARRFALGVISNGGGNHRWARSPFPRPSWYREAE